ncbi:MAG: hypothetical protein NTAFB01_13560 [Nitrospira sp.]
MLGGAFTLGGQYTLGAGPVGNALLGDGVQLFLDGAVIPVQDGSIELETSLNERALLTFALINPPIAPLDGQRVLVLRDEERLFAGHIWSVSQRVTENKTASSFDIRCVDLAAALERQVKKATYLDQSARMIVEDVLRNDLNAEGIWAGRIDEGARFPLVDADYVRCSELLRDVADGAGLISWVDAFGRLHCVLTLVDVAPYMIQAGTAGQIQVEKSKETYKNVAFVTCRSQDGSTEVLVERSNSTEIAARQAREGGSGRYEVHSKIQHPTSNDSIELQRLATTYAVIQLSRSAAIKQTLSCRTFTHGLQVGQSLTVTLAEYQASGSWTITKLRMKQLTRSSFQYEVEAVQSSLFDRLQDAYLQIVGAGRAIVQLPIGLFSTVIEFLSTTSWTVPGSGQVEIEIDGFAPGGGGGGYDGIGPSGTGLNGGAGGSGGKAVTFLSVPAGTVLDIVVPTAGGTPGFGDAGLTATFTTPTTTTWTVPYAGVDVRVELTVNGAGGGSGANPGSDFCSGVGGDGGKAVSWRIYPGGTVLDIVVGAAGIAGAPPFGHGTDGGLSRVSLSGVTIAQGNGGGGGKSSLEAPPIDGAAGGGTGDFVTTGGGAAGAPPKCLGGGFGFGGSNGSVSIFYSFGQDGIVGGNVTVSLGGVVKMQANGGGGGRGGGNDGTAGTPGGGIGDQIFTGGGSAGGAGGIAGSIDGKAGALGKVQIRY